jgi:tetratricopeptide (TPR) repeat protein
VNGGRPPQANRVSDFPWEFRHALLRDGALQLLLPSDRCRLHALAARVLERLSGGRPPRPGLLLPREPGFVPHASDSAALEIALHARLALQAGAPAETEDLEFMRTLYLHRGAEHAERNAAWDDARRSWSTLAESGTEADRARVLFRAGWAAFAGSRVPDAEVHYRAARARAEAVGDPDLVARIDGFLAMTLHQLGRLQEAGESYERASRFVGDRDPLQRASILGVRGTFFQDMGRLSEASECYETALALLREAGRVDATAVTLGNLGLLLKEMRDYGRAEEVLLSSLDIAVDAGDRRQEAVALANLALVLAAAGRHREAEDRYAESLRIHRQVGNRRFEGIALGNLALVQLHRGDYGAAETGLLRSLQMHRDTANRRSEGIVLGTLGGLLRWRRSAREAVPLLRSALEIHSSVRNPAFEHFDRRRLARSLCDLGEWDEANAAARRCLALESRSDVESRADAQLVLVGVLAGMGRVHEMEEAAAGAVDIAAGLSAADRAAFDCRLAVIRIRAGDMSAGERLWSLARPALDPPASAAFAAEVDADFERARNSRRGDGPGSR